MRSRRSRARPAEPTVFDAFDPDGTFLGPVRVPEGVDPTVFQGEPACEIRHVDLDETYVTRTRIVHE